MVLSCKPEVYTGPLDSPVGNWEGYKGEFYFNGEKVAELDSCSIKAISFYKQGFCCIENVKGAFPYTYDHASGDLQIDSTRWNVPTLTGAEMVMKFIDRILPPEPVVPEKPVEPEKPSEPAGPGDTETPGEVETPEDDGPAVEPENPEDPGDAGEPTEPEEPGQPEEPVEFTTEIASVSAAVNDYIAELTAELSGDVSLVTECWFMAGYTPDKLSKIKGTLEGTAAKAYLAGLEPGTYWYKAVISNGTETKESEILSFSF